MILISKSVYKLNFSNYWRIGEHESWFEDMALQGLHLKHIGMYFTKFIKGEPKEMRYRIDVLRDDDITAEQKESYSKRGWDYVTSYNEFHVFSSPAYINAPEFYMDPDEQSHTLEKLNKKFKSSALGSIIWIVIFIGMTYYNWTIDNTPTLSLVNGNAISQIVLIIPIANSVYSTINGAIGISFLRKSLKQGKHINHNAKWENSYRLNCISNIFYTIVVITPILISLTQMIITDVKTLPINNIDLPIIRLKDIEKDPNLVREKSYIQDNVDWDNRYTRDWSLLAPIQYESDEQGVVSNKKWKDRNAEYSPNIYTKVYKLRFESMSNDLISDLMKRYHTVDENKKFRKINHKELDTLVVWESDIYKDVYAYKGDVVIHVIYNGYGDLDSIIDNIVDKINLIAD